MQIKTDVFYIDSTRVSEVRANAMNAVERSAFGMGLNKKETLQLRLMTEELFGLIDEIAKSFVADFWLEGHDKSFEIHLNANMDVNQEKKEELLAVASNGKNAAAPKGIMGKLGAVCEQYLLSQPTTDQSWVAYGMMDPMMTGNLGYTVLWSLNQYSKAVESEADKEEEAWDELEKSIMSHLADDVIVGVKGNAVELTVKKNFA